METYKINAINPHHRFIKKTTDFLLSGEIVAYPTDINYGFGCLLSSASGVKKLNLLANRLGRTKYHTIICKDFSDLSKYAIINNYAYRIMKKILPGPYTVILEATTFVPKICQTKRKTIGIRVIDSAIIRSLIDALDSPLLNMTALPKDEERLLESPEEIIKLYKNDLACILDIGDVPSFLTTVIDLTTDEVQIVREGVGKINFI
jgi:tRNA threonylcarbamoyl adenosine modification protein (Sua5/YciO/YrdC/YwlC family)